MQSKVTAVGGMYLLVVVCLFAVYMHTNSSICHFCVPGPS